MKKEMINAAFWKFRITERLKQETCLGLYETQLGLQLQGLSFQSDLSLS